MRLILTILLIGLFKAEGQMIINASYPYRPLVQPAANLLLDDYPNAAAAYSLRKLDKDYTGACMRIRRVDNSTESDIGFVNNYLDTTAIKNFTGSGTAAAVVTWFDQSGNGRSATQSVAANQPYIMINNFVFATIDGLNTSEKAIVFNQANFRLISDFTTISQPISAFTYGRKDNVTTAAAGVYYDSYNNTASALFYTGTNESPNNRWGLSLGTGLFGTTAGNTNPNLFSTLHNGASSSIHINGQSYVSGNAGTNGLNGLAIGNVRGNPSPVAGGYELNGRIAELIIYGSNQSTNRTAIENNINDYYNIYWNGDFTGILDTYGSSAAAYSLRNLSSTYTGPLIRVRKDTTGQPEMDVYGDYYGNLDTMGLKQFLSTRSGFISVWYDQSGNSRNASQATQANQPRIANLGVIDRQGTRPTIFFTLGNTFAITNSFTSPTSWSIFNVSKRRASSTSNVFLSGSNTGGGNPGLIHYNDNNIYILYFNGANFRYKGVLQNTSTFDLLEGHNNSGTSHSVYRNNVQLTLGAEQSGLGQNQFNTIGQYAVTANRADGTGSEIILFSVDQTSNRSGIASNINTYYGIY